jgi:hypothetical protein
MAIYHPSSHIIQHALVNVRNESLFNVRLRYRHLFSSRSTWYV